MHPSTLNPRLAEHPYGSLFEPSRDLSGFLTQRPDPKASACIAPTRDLTLKPVRIACYGSQPGPPNKGPLIESLWPLIVGIWGRGQLGGLGRSRALGGFTAYCLFGV